MKKETKNETKAKPNDNYVYQEGQILSAIKNCLTKYSGDVEITDNFMFNMKDTVNTITLYSASKFVTGDTDELGNKKYFFNVLNPMCDNASKNIDIDRKNIEIRAEKVADRIPAMLYNNELKNWMEKTHFGLLLNDIVWSLPRDGSVILKKKKDGSVGQVELRYGKMDPAVNSERGSFDISSSFFIEPHVMDLKQFDEMRTTKWNQVAIDEVTSRVMAKMASGPTYVPDIRVQECYMLLPNNLFKQGAKGYDNYLIFALINDEDDIISLGLERVLYYAKGVKPQYKKVDYRTIVGRALGFGLMEAGFDAQERFNEMQNQLASSMRSTTKTNYQTRDKNVARNILTDTLDGEVITVQDDLRIVPNEKRDLGSFNTAMSAWMENLRMNAQANEVLTGETMPSDTPYRTVQQLSVAGGKFFDLVRENLSLFLNEVITDWILPDFEKELKKKKEIDLIGADLWQELVEREANRKLDEAIIKYIRANKKSPTQEEIDTTRERLINTASKDIFLNIKEDFFDFKKYLYIDISGERSNVQRQTESLINALTMIVQNPASLQDPTIWKVFSAILENTGIGLDMVNKTPQPEPQAGATNGTTNGITNGITTETSNGIASANIPSMAEAARNLSMAPGGTESTQINNQITE